jgi:hypothetical protein
LVGLAVAGCGSSTDKEPEKKSGERPLHLINSIRYKGKPWRIYGHLCSDNRVCLVSKNAVMGGGAVLDPKSTKFDIRGVDMATFSGDYLNDKTTRTFAFEAGVVPEAITEVVFSTPLRRFGAGTDRISGLPGRYFSYVIPGGSGGGDRIDVKREGSVLYITRAPARR